MKFLPIGLKNKIRRKITLYNLDGAKKSDIRSRIGGRRMKKCVFKFITLFGFIFGCNLEPNRVEVTNSRFSQELELSSPVGRKTDYEPGGYMSQTYWSLADHGKKFNWSFDFKYHAGDKLYYFPDQDNSSIGGIARLYFNGILIGTGSAGVNADEHRMPYGNWGPENDNYMSLSKSPAEFPGPGLYYINLEFYDVHGVNSKYTSPILEVVE